MKYCILVCERMFGVGCLPLHNLKFLLTKVFSKHEEFQQHLGVHHCYNHLPIFDGSLMPTFHHATQVANLCYSCLLNTLTQHHVQLQLHWRASLDYLLYKHYTCMGLLTNISSLWI